VPYFGPPFFSRFIMTFCGRAINGHNVRRAGVMLAVAAAGPP
jgi:hypothetical protein